MKISRWIYIPVIHTVLVVLASSAVIWAFGGSITSSTIWVWIIQGLVTIFITIYDSDRKARKISKDSDPQVFEYKQNRSLVVLLDFERTFNFCREAVLLIKRGKVTNEDFANGIIKGKSRADNYLFAEEIEIRLLKINETLTEIELTVRPALKTAMLTNGTEWKIAEDICNYLKEKDAEINKKVLTDSLDLLDDIYVKPFQKETAK